MYLWVCHLPSPRPTLITEADSYIVSALRMIGRTPSFKHILRMLKSFLENGGNGLHKRVILVDLCSVYLLTWLHCFQELGAPNQMKGRMGKMESLKSWRMKLGWSFWMKRMECCLSSHGRRSPLQRLIRPTLHLLWGQWWDKLGVSTFFITIFPI